MSLDTPSRRALQRTLRHSLKSGAFVKEFTAGLVKVDVKRPTPSAATALLQWSTLVLQHLDPAAAQKAVAKLIECQAKWLEVVAASGQRRGAAQTAVSAALRCRPALLPVYLAVASSLGES